MQSRWLNYTVITLTSWYSIESEWKVYSAVGISFQKTSHLTFCSGSFPCVATCISKQSLLLFNMIAPSIVDNCLQLCEVCAIYSGYLSAIVCGLRHLSSNCLQLYVVCGQWKGDWQCCKHLLPQCHMSWDSRAAKFTKNKKWSMEKCWWFFHVHLCRSLFEDAT